MPLEQNSILTQYFDSLFGHASFEGLKDVLRSCGEERDEDGISQFCRRLEGAEDCRSWRRCGSDRAPDKLYGNIERNAPQAQRASGQRVEFTEVMHLIDDGELYAKTLQWTKRTKTGNMFLSRRKFQDLLEASTALVPDGETENQAVRRNSDRFPDDFMFELDREEIERYHNL